MIQSVGVTRVEKNMTFRLGDPVELKSGSMRKTVVAITEGTVTCAWEERGERREERYRIEELQPARTTPGRATDPNYDPFNRP